MLDYMMLCLPRTDEEARDLQRSSIYGSGHPGFCGRDEEYTLIGRSTLTYGNYDPISGQKHIPNSGL